MDQQEALKNLSMANEDGSKRNKVEPIFHFVAHKAGMQKVDKEKITAIIAEASRDSRFYNKQMQKKAKYDESIEKMKEKIDKFKKDKQQVLSAQVIIEKKLTQLEKERILSKTWVHVDMDMFFVACEIRDCPELKDKPVAVGGIGMISTANYIARQYGVRSAMPGFIAKKLCPELVLIPGNYEKYKETSKRFKQIIKEYDSEYESGGLDEAVLDLTDYLNEHGITESQDIEKVCYEMRMKINAATGITCSCGIGPNKMLAKLSTEINKPNGQYYMKPNKEEILEFLYKLPVRKIPGVGSTSEMLLNGLGINTCKDILDNLLEIYIGFTELTFDFFLRSALGIARCYHEQPEERKSVNVSRTFQAISKTCDMENKIREIAGFLSEDLQYCKKKAKHITLTVKTHNFDVRNKGTMVEKFTDDQVEIANVCIKLLHELLPLEPLRLIGIKAGQLSSDDKLNTLDNFFKKFPSNVENNNNINSKNIQETHEEDKIDHEKFENDEETNSHPFSGFMMQEMRESVKINITSGQNDKNPDIVLHQVENQENQTLPKLKKEDVICPICFMKFESTMNYSKINKHIDRCLLQVEVSTSTGSRENVKPIISHEENSKNIIESAEKKGDSKKRKADDSNKQNGTLKKTKKTQESSNLMKLESFFTKK